jgi:hypothetical protein
LSTKPLVAQAYVRWSPSSNQVVVVGVAVVPTDCSDGRPSDTEELLGRHEYGTSNEKEVSEDKSDTLNQPPKTERRQLSFEVSISHSLHSARFIVHI